MDARFLVESHTDDPLWCCRVVDTKTGETFGFGLLFADALALAIELDVRGQPASD